MSWKSYPLRSSHIACSECTELNGMVWKWGNTGKFDIFMFDSSINEEAHNTNRQFSRMHCQYHRNAVKLHEHPAVPWSERRMKPPRSSGKIDSENKGGTFGTNCLLSRNRGLSFWVYSHNMHTTIVRSRRSELKCYFRAKGAKRYGSI